MKDRKSKFIRKIEVEAPYWSLFGHCCSSVSYLLTSQDKFIVAKVQ